MPRTSEILTLCQSPLLDARVQTRSATVLKTVQLEKSLRAVKFFRAAWRLLLFCGTLAWAAVDFAVRVWFASKRSDIRARSEWMSRAAQAVLKCVNVRAEYIGEPPRSGLLVSNHLSYLDIIVLGARQPAVFVSKADVRHWPALGYLAGLAGTLFVRRERRLDVSPLNEQMSALVQAGVVVIVFPEGTSSDGVKVLPFFSSLLEPAAVSGCAVTPAFIRYEVTDGVAADEVCYWRDMTFGPHFLNLLTKLEIRATVRFGPPRAAGTDRKQLSRELHQAVRKLGGV